MTARTYAGIGARRTPAAVQAHMRQLARELGEGGWHLRSGGAHGADHAFALGAPDGSRTLFLPWAGFNGRAGAGVRVLSSAECTRLEPLAAAHHPAWGRCSDAVRKLHARNAAVLLGPDADAPVDAVVCWTEGGQVTGGTGMAIRLARHHRIPVLNLAVLGPGAVRERLGRLAARGDGSAEAAGGRSGRGAGRERAQQRMEEGMAGIVNLDRRPDLHAALKDRGEAGGVVRIDRRTRWGNPFHIGRHGSRAEVIRRYRAWLWERILRGHFTLEDLARLHGKTLACHCHPLPCHGQVLQRAAQWAVKTLAAQKA